MPVTLSDIEAQRIKAMLRKSLGRDLTPDELRYIGLSSVMLPEEEPEPEK